jgi:hypothetical protein
MKGSEVRKKKTLTKEEHEAIGADIKKFSREFSDHFMTLQRANGKSSKQAKILRRVLHNMTCRLCMELESKWYSQGFTYDNGECSPYSGKDKVTW